MEWQQRVGGNSGRESPRSFVVEVPSRKKKTVSFDVVRASRFAQLCNLSYFIRYQDSLWAHPWSQQRGWYKDPQKGAEALGYSDFCGLSAADMDVGISANDEGIIVAFRGTEKFRTAEWWRAFSKLRVDAPLGGKVHKGCSESLDKPLLADKEQTLQEGIESAIGRMREKHPRAALYFSGHSVGGGLACISAARMLESQPGIQIKAIYSFGQPRVGNEAFMQALTSHAGLGSYYRVILDKDPMVLFPSKYGAGRNKRHHDDETPIYRHGGIPILLHAKSARIESRGAPESLRHRFDTDDEANVLFHKNPGHYSQFQHHLNASYIDALARVQERVMGGKGQDI